MRRVSFAANPVSSVREFPSSPPTDDDSPFPPTPPPVYPLVGAAPSTSSSSSSSCSTSPSSSPSQRHSSAAPPSPSEYSSPRNARLTPPPSPPDAQPLIYTPSPTLSTLSFSPNGQAHTPSPKFSALHLHPALASLPTGAALGGALAAFPPHVLSEPATHPPQARLVIQSDLLPWQAAADAQHQQHQRQHQQPFTTVGDVLAALSSLLRARASEQEFHSELAGRQRAVRLAYLKRAATDARAREQGLRRVDFLEGREVVGLRAVPSSAGGGAGAVVCELLLGPGMSPASS